MNTADINACDALERIFHEPNRLAIMSALGAARGGVTFNDLKEQCRLTDGNLSRHLKVLETAAAVRIEKAFVESRPRTTVFITRAGLRDFGDYLKALEEVLKAAQRRLAANGKPAMPGAIARAVRAREET